MIYKGVRSNSFTFIFEVKIFFIVFYLHVNQLSLTIKWNINPANQYTGATAKVNPHGHSRVFPYQTFAYYTDPPLRSRIVVRYSTDERGGVRSIIITVKFHLSDIYLEKFFTFTYRCWQKQKCDYRSIL